jgi:multimeric flavodoxin WrbA
VKVVVMHASPNRDGLTAAAAAAAAGAIRAAGPEVEEVRLNDLDLQHCQACNNGWGTCRESQRCCQDDAFPALHRRVVAADALVLVTPVYFGEPSESMKAFMDRLRRCEAPLGSRPGGLAGKPMLIVAAAGGSGNGAVHCLRMMERWMEHVGAKKHDFIGITRFIRAYRLPQIAEAARAMVAESAAGAG